MKFLFMALLLVSCAEDPVSISQTNNPKVNVSLLFEHEGCRVYRFMDSGNFRYYTDCDETFWSETHQCGKTQCTEHKSIKTNRRKK